MQVIKSVSVYCSNLIIFDPNVGLGLYITYKKLIPLYGHEGFFLIPFTARALALKNDHRSMTLSVYIP